MTKAPTQKDISTNALKLITQISALKEALHNHGRMQYEHDCNESGLDYEEPTWLFGTWPHTLYYWEGYHEYVDKEDQAPKPMPGSKWATFNPTENEYAVLLLQGPQGHRLQAAFYNHNQCRWWLVDRLNQTPDWPLPDLFEIVAIMPLPDPCQFLEASTQ